MFQLADEPRHLEMDTEVFQRAGIPELDWLPAWEAPGTTCRFFRRVLELDDTFETLVKANFVAEGAAGPGRFAILADGAEARGDMFSALNHRARVRDETRHISFARAPPRRLAPPHPPRPRSGRLAARPDPPGVPLAGAPPPHPSVRSLTASSRQRRMARGQRAIARPTLAFAPTKRAVPGAGSGFGPGRAPAAQRRWPEVALSVPMGLIWEENT